MTLPVFHKLHEICIDNAEKSDGKHQPSKPEQRNTALTERTTGPLVKLALLTPLFYLGQGTRHPVPKALQAVVPWRLQSLQVALRCFLLCLLCVLIASAVTNFVDTIFTKILALQMHVPHPPPPLPPQKNPIKNNKTVTCRCKGNHIWNLPSSSFKPQAQ